MSERKKVIDAIVARNIQRKCEACGQDVVWTVPSLPGDADTVQRMLLVSPENIMNGFAFVPMICPNCSNTRLLHLETLLKANGEAAHE